MHPHTEHPPFRFEYLNNPARAKYAYTPPPNTAQRCNCGSRFWTVNCGGSMPAQVACTRCSNANRTATAWLAGYDAGRHPDPQDKPSI